MAGSAGAANAQPEASWSDEFAFTQGIPEPVTSLADYNGQLVAGTPNGVRTWDGAAWKLIPEGPTQIVAMTTIDSFLYVASDGRSPTTVYRWDGTSWRRMGRQLAVRGSDALAVFQGRIFAGGAFVGGVRRWNEDTDTWDVVGGGIQGTVSALVVHEAHLYAGGLFVDAGGAPANYIAKWDGISWSSLSSTGANSHVTSLLSWGGKLVVGGAFTHVGRFQDAVESNCIATWDGQAWQALDTGMETSDRRIPFVHALTVHDQQLVAAGDFDHAGGAPTGNVARWNGSTWIGFGDGGANGPVKDVISWNGMLVAGGSFSRVGALPGRHVSFWDGTRWSFFAGGHGLPGEVRALTLYRGDLVVGGVFLVAGSEEIPVRNLARWDGTRWHDIGRGVNGPVNSVTVIDTTLVVGGKFTEAGDISVRHIATWDGVRWDGLGVHTMRTCFGVEGEVHALQNFEGNLIVGGAFDNFNGATVRNAVRWDGNAWFGMGPHRGSQCNEIRSFAVHEDRLFGGWRGTSGVNVWDGQSWQGVGPAPGGFVHALESTPEGLLAGGTFIDWGETGATHVARLDATDDQWVPLGNPGAPVFDYAIYHGQVVAVGAGNAEPGRGIARWNGQEWIPLGFSLDLAEPAPTARGAVQLGRDLFVGGSFSRVGGRPSSNIARWLGTEPPEIQVALLHDPRFTEEVSFRLGLMNRIELAEVSLEVDGEPVSVAPMDSTVASWAGGFRIAQDRAQSMVRACGRNRFSLEACATSGWSHAFVRKASGGRVSSHDERARLFLSPASLRFDAHILVVSPEIVDLSHDPGNLSTSPPPPRHAPDRASNRVESIEIASYWTSPRGILTGLATIEFSYDESVLGGSPSTHLQIVGPQGNTLPSIVDPAMQTVAATVEEMGLFRLVLERSSASRSADPLFLSVQQNVPNPFNPTTRIDFEIRATQQVRVDVFDVLGKRVATLLDRTLPAGLHSAAWDGRTRGGRRAASGVYVYRITGAQVAATRKMLLVR